MAFRNANLGAHMLKFNSSASMNLLYLYQDIIEEEIKAKNSEPKHRTFAPSQMRCDRVSWFRLRGTEPDKIDNPDSGLDFTAKIGTACHEIIQERLRNQLESDWIAVEDWVKCNPDKFKDYQWSLTGSGYETLIDMVKPYPVRFACDGILRLNGIIYLLEIKTAEFSSLQDLVEPKEKHLDQIKCYSTLLHIPNVLFLYQDRQYGEMKCFEITVSESDQVELRARMDSVIRAVESNIAPEGLPVGDPNCSPNMCPYYRVCKQWGR